MSRTCFLARRLLFSKYKNSFRSSAIVISIVGIFFATFLVTMGLGVLFGYQKVYYKAVLNFSTHIIVSSDIGIGDDSQKNMGSFFASLQKDIPFSYSPYRYYETLAPGSHGMRALIFKGVDFGKLNDVYPLNYDLSASYDGDVLIGKEVYRFQPDAVETKKVRYLIFSDDSDGRYQHLSILGDFSSGYHDFDSRFVLMPIALLNQRFFSDSAVSGYEIRLADMKNIPLLYERLSEELGREYQILTWEDLNRDLFDALKVDRTVVFTVCFLILLIACLNIFGFNFLFFIERQHEFAILSALGMSLKNLRKLLSVLSLLLGGVAAVAGGALGFVSLYVLSKSPGIRLDPEIYFVQKVPFAFNLVWFGVFILTTVLFCYLTSKFAGRVVLKRQVFLV